MIFDSARNSECLFTKSDNRPERRTSLRLKPEKNTRCLQNRSFPLPVSPDKKIKARRQIDSKRFEAAKIPELKFGEHE